MEADSLDELHGLIPETIHLLMVDLLEDNELDRYLRDKGWQAVGVPASGDGDVEFDVPWYLVVPAGFPRRQADVDCQLAAPSPDGWHISSKGCPLENLTPGYLKSTNGTT